MRGFLMSLQTNYNCRWTAETNMEKKGKARKALAVPPTLLGSNAEWLAKSSALDGRLINTFKS